MLFRICLILSHILPTVYRILLKKPLSFVLFCSGIGSFTDGCGSEAGGTASCGISVVGGTTAFFEDFPVETCFFSFLSSEESYTVKKGSLPEAFPAADNCKRFAPDRITIGLLRKNAFHRHSSVRMPYNKEGKTIPKVLP